MNAQSVLHRESPQGFGDDAVAFLDGQFLKCLVLEPRDFLALVKVADPSFETDVASRAKILKLTPCRFGVDRCLGKAEVHQPPATGGMKTTASLAASLRDQSLNSLLTATFNCSLDSVKP